MLRICKPIIKTVKDVILNSGFCVDKSLTELLYKGVYA